jgi:hypothetical protein
LRSPRGLFWAAGRNVITVSITSRSKQASWTSSRWLMKRRQRLGVGLLPSGWWYSSRGPKSSGGWRRAQRRLSSSEHPRISARLRRDPGPVLVGDGRRQYNHLIVVQRCLRNGSRAVPGRLAAVEGS